MSKKTQVIENRKYKRLESCIAIDFTIVRLNSELPGVGLEKGTTSNISRGGLCLETDDLSETMIKYLSKEGIYLDMSIHAPLSSAPVKAVGEIIWHKPIEVNQPNHFMIGIKFHSITDENLDKLMGRVACINYIRNSIIIGALVVFIILILIKVVK